MRNSVLPVMTVLVVVAGAAGLQLGETTIAQIDPLYFQGAAPPAQDVTRNAARLPANAYAAASGWERGYADRSADCGANCAPSFVDRAIGLPTDSPLIAYTDATIEPRWEQADGLAPDEMPPNERIGDAGRVQRYLHYPVSDEQRDIRAALDGERDTAGTPGL